MGFFLFWGEFAKKSEVDFFKCFASFAHKKIEGDRFLGSINKNGVILQLVFKVNGGVILHSNIIMIYHIRICIYIIYIYINMIYGCDFTYWGAPPSGK